MVWHVDRVLSYPTVEEPTDVLYDGRYTWVCAARKVFIFDTFDLYEEEQKDPFEYEELKNAPLKLIREIDLLHLDIPTGFGDSYYLAKVGDYVYVSSGKTYNQVMRLHRTDPYDTFITTTLPKTMNSNIGAGANKLWFVNSHQSEDSGSDRQRMYSFDINSNTFSYDEIPTTKQKKERYIAYPYNGEVYVTDTNNVSVSKFTVGNGLFASTIRTGNRNPTYMSVTDDKDLRVFSVNGMAQNINTVSASVTNLFGTLDVVLGVGENEDYYWFLDDLGGLKRVQKSNNYMRLTGGDQPDYTIKTDEFSELGVPTTGSVSKVLNDKDKFVLGGAAKGKGEGYLLYRKLTWTSGPHIDTDFRIISDDDGDVTISGTVVDSIQPGDAFEVDDIAAFKNRLTTSISRDFDRWNGSAIETVTLDPYVFVLSSTKVQAFRATRLYRENYRNLSATGMVSTGLEDFTGD